MINEDERKPNYYEKEKKEISTNVDKDEGHEILKGYLYKIHRSGIKGNKANYECKYPDCGKIFSKTWNFLDHARMHECIKPFICKL